MVARANKECDQGLPYLQGRHSRNNLNSSETTGVQIIRLSNWPEMQQVKNNKSGTAVIYTDSKITLDSMRSAKNHDHLVEEIRKRTVNLGGGTQENRI